jgi:hypothetical protein
LIFPPQHKEEVRGSYDSSFALLAPRAAPLQINVSIQGQSFDIVFATKELRDRIVHVLRTLASPTERSLLGLPAI